MICASTGNTSASAAAYAARAGIPAVVLVPEGAVAGAKVAQVRMLGARVLDARGSFDEALAAVRELADRGSHALVNSVNPYRLEGSEDCRLRDRRSARRRTRRVRRSPTEAVATRPPTRRGSRELGLASRIVSCEAAEPARTLASAIRIADPVHADEVAEAAAVVVTISDEEIVEAWRELAVEEGVFCEPSSAAGLAAIRAGRVDGDRLVVTLTGHGLKDTAAAERYAPPARPVDPDPDAIAEASR